MMVPNEKQMEEWAKEISDEIISEIEWERNVILCGDDFDLDNIVG